MIDVLKAAVPLGFLLSLMPGAAFFVLLETSASKGFRAGVSFDLGVVFADVIFILAAYFSSFQLIQNLSNQPGLYVLGGVILLGYGIVTFMDKASKKAGYRDFQGSYLGLFTKGFFLNIINFGVFFFWVGVLMWAGPALGNDNSKLVAFFATLIGTYFCVDLLKILAAKQLKRRLTQDRVSLLRKGLGIILAICGTALITQGFLPKDHLGMEGMEVSEPNRNATDKD